jgi:serine/threonine protein kinase SCH9
VTHSTTSGTLGVHAYNGPLGYDRPNGTQHQNGTANGRSTQSIQIKKSKKKDAAGSPLTNSVQENFRGFTFHGGESVTAPDVLRSGLNNNRGDEAVSEEEVPEVTTEDECEERGLAGRYANARRKGVAWEDDL